MVAVAKRKGIDPGFGQRLRSLREARNLTQGELAERAAMRYQEVSRLEREDREPSWSTALRLAKALGVTLDELAPREEADPITEPPAEGRAMGKRK